MSTNVGSSNLPPIAIPAGSPLVPEWAKEAVRRLNMITGATFVVAQTHGGYGSAIFSFTGDSAQMVVPLGGVTGSYDITKATAGGKSGRITVSNGLVTSFTSPT